MVGELAEETGKGGEFPGCVFLQRSGDWGLGVVWA